MCLGIPGRVTRTYREHDVLTGTMDFGGIGKRICLEYAPDVRFGQSALVHVGFALSAIDGSATGEEEAGLAFESLDRMNQLSELRTPSSGGRSPAGSFSGGFTRHRAEPRTGRHATRGRNGGPDGGRARATKDLDGNRGVGATMVSAEGTCAAHYAYGRHLESSETPSESPGVHGEAPQSVRVGTP